ncbi:MAG: hypothetical protein H7Y18_03230 [Clostridiaceae bacterium]|nr:hypothetical protein [Clostridiaceae bacterium]
MDFIVRRFNSLLGIAFFTIIIVGVMYLFINILPFILIIGLIIWMFFKVTKILKSVNKKKDSVIVSMSDSNVNSNEFTNGQIIDVEYKEL